MSMTLHDMSNIATLTRNYASSTNSSSASGASATPDSVSQALDSANKRISAQISQTSVQLSSYGQIKSGFASLQNTGQALTTLAKNASVSDVSKATQSFVDAYNSTNSAISTAVKGNDKSAGTLAGNALANRSGSDLHRIVVSNSSSADLKNIGISVNQNGSLTVDTKALEKAVQANPDAVKNTLAKLGQQANTTATNELSSSGAVGSAVNSLNQRAKSLATQQTQEQSLAASAQAAIQQSANQTSGFSSGIADYMKIFSL